MSSEERRRGIRWANHTTASNETTGPVREATIGRVAYPRPVPNMSNAKKAEIGENVIRSRQSLDINRGEVGQFSSTRISGVTDYEAEYAAKLLQNMTPCEAIRTLLATPSRKLLGLPEDFIRNPDWNAVLDKPLRLTRGRRVRNRIRHNVAQGAHLGYKEKERIAWLIASQYGVNPDDCVAGYLSEYERPNNLPADVEHGRMENFLGGTRTRKTRSRKAGTRKARKSTRSRGPKKTRKVYKTRTHKH